MASTDIRAKPTEQTAPSPMLLPIVPPLIGIALWMLTLVALAIGLYLVPDVIAIGLAAITSCALLSWVVWQHPEIGLVGLIFLVTGFLPADLVDLRLPIGGLELRALCLLGMIGLLRLRQLTRAQPIIPWPRVG